MRVRTRKVETDTGLNVDKIPKSTVTLRAEQTLKNLVMLQILLEEMTKRVNALSQGVLDMDRQLAGK